MIDPEVPFLATGIRNGLKQYKFIVQVINHRIAELLDRDEEIIQLQMVR